MQIFARIFVTKFAYVQFFVTALTHVFFLPMGSVVPSAPPLPLRGGTLRSYFRVLQTIRKTCPIKMKQGQVPLL